MFIADWLNILPLVLYEKNAVLVLGGFIVISRGYWSVRYMVDQAKLTEDI